MQYSKFIRLWDVSDSFYLSKYLWGIPFLLYNFLFFFYIKSSAINNGSIGIVGLYFLLLLGFTVPVIFISMFLSNFISYPIRIRRVKELAEQKKCVTREQAGKILGCYVLKKDFHFWQGCKCQCGKTRNAEHDWNGCKCKICEKTKYAGHDWNGCKCKICGKTRDEGHDWNGCKCEICGKTRNEGHDWHGCKCKICGATQHNWVNMNNDDCQCKRCKKTEWHDWKHFAGSEWSSDSQDFVYNQYWYCKKCHAVKY